SNRPVHLSIIGLATKQFQRAGAHGQNFATVFVNRQNGRFVQNDALFRRVNDCVNGTQIDCQVIGEKATKNIHDGLPLTSSCSARKLTACITFRMSNRDPYSNLHASWSPMMDV